MKKHRLDIVGNAVNGRENRDWTRGCMRCKAYIDYPRCWYRQPRKQPNQGYQMTRCPYNINVKVKVNATYGYGVRK